MDEKINHRLHNAMIEVAVCEFWENKIAETDWSKDGDHEFSVRHTKQIKAVIRKYKAEGRRKKLFRAVKQIAIVVLIIFSVSFTVLMSSAAIRAEAVRMVSQFRELFAKLGTGELTVEEYNERSIDMQIEQLEGAISDALNRVELPVDTSFTIHVDGWHNVTLSGLNEADAAKIKPYIEPMGAILSTAYTSESKNQLYYVQSVINGYEDIKDEPTDIWKDTIQEYRQIIREYMFANNKTSTDEIMAQTRNISYADGELIFEIK